MAVGGIMGWEYTGWDVTDQHGCWRHNGVAALREYTGWDVTDQHGCWWHNGVAALREYTGWDVTDQHGCWRHNGVGIYWLGCHRPAWLLAA